MPKIPVVCKFKTTIGAAGMLKVRLLQSSGFSLLLLVCSVHAAAYAHAQTMGGRLRGQVTDPSGAAVAKATVTLFAPSGQSLGTMTSKEGLYELNVPTAGKYSVKVVSPGFSVFLKDDVEIGIKEVQELDIALTIEIQKEKVEVNEPESNLDVDPRNNMSMLVLNGKDLEALSDDPEELLEELKALAGPSAGPNGGEVYIDGFAGGKLPPKSSIREIRINQNPFSAEYDHPGYGRIEVFTKPGTDYFLGQVTFGGNTRAFNSRNPFDLLQNGAPPHGYNSTQVSGNIGGPLSARASYFIGFERRDIHELALVSAKTLDSGFNPVDFTSEVPNPRIATSLSPRLDYRVGKNNTLTVSYSYGRANDTNSGVGQFSLPSHGFNQASEEQNIQISETQILSAKTINETRFRFNRQTSEQIPLSTTPAISVQGAFTAGGNSGGAATDRLDRYEFQNYTSMSLGRHFFKYGVRLRDDREINESRSNFNGTFTFGLRQNPQCAGSSPAATCPGITGLEAYQLTLKGLAEGLTVPTIVAEGGGASQYIVGTGTARAEVNHFDAGLYLQDEWRIRPNLMLSEGLRFEAQNDIRDHADFAPRLGIAWGIGSNRAKNASFKTVLRAGYGIFYDRFTYSLALQQERLNGSVQRQFFFANPKFFLDRNGHAPALSSLLDDQQGGTIAPTIYQANPDLRAPYIMQAAVTLERELAKHAKIAFTYLTSRGVHQFFSENINAPICATFPCDPSISRRPLGGAENIYQYQSEGVFKQNEVRINTNVRMGSKLTLFGFYMLSYANGDASGAGSFPSTANNISLDYGRTALDVRHRVSLSGSVSLPYGVRLSPLLNFNSGTPFSLTTGQDLNGDSIFNDRPAVASSHSIPSNVLTNKFGSFDLVPQPGETIVPINSSTSAGRFSLNLRVSKSFTFGKKSEAPSGRGSRVAEPLGRNDRGYNLTVSASVRNIFNNVNLATPIGNLSSPLFGQSIALAGGTFSGLPGNRRIDLQATLVF